MKKQTKVLFLLFGILSAGNSLAETLLPAPLPEGTPQEVEGFYSRSLYKAYRVSIDKDVSEASQKSLQLIRANFPAHKKQTQDGVSFRYYPVTQTNEDVRGVGQIYYACDRKKICDWVMKVSTLPIIDSYEWAYKNFDAATAVSNLKARNIEPDDSIIQLGFLMNLPSPKSYILANAKKQLYYGEECPAFVSVLGIDYYGQERGRHLMDMSTMGAETLTPKHVSGAEFEFSILENASELKVYYARPSIVLKFSKTLGDEIGNKLFESIKNCTNRAD